MLSLLFVSFGFTQGVQLKISKHYLNIPLGDKAKLYAVDIKVKGEIKREFPAQIATDTISYWVYIDVSEFKGQTITLSSLAPVSALRRIYQDDKINGADSLYKESNRPQFHFTVKRGWSNDINGPVYYNGQYHLFWQAFPFGLHWNTAYMYWGHAVSKDMLHWQELDPALMPDSLGSPWSGTAVIDNNDDGGWGRNALVLYYACYDGMSGKQVQCVAYSNDNGKTFTRIKGNPVIDSNDEMGTNDTRDPKVFWYEQTKQWVMVLFEKDGMSFYNSTDMKKWIKKSHFQGLWECPDFFDLPVDGKTGEKKWVLHGGSSDYFIGRFNGSVFTPESDRLHYAEGQSEKRGDYLYAAESFQNMPDDRRVQMAWGRVDHSGMPFSQMMLFPTEFSLKTTDSGLRLRAQPVREIEQLHGAHHSWTGVTPAQANGELAKITSRSLHVKMKFTLPKGHLFSLRFQGNPIFLLKPEDFHEGENEIELLIDRTVAELFVNGGERYIINGLPEKLNDKFLEFDSEQYGPSISWLEVYEMNPVWQ